MQCAVLLYCLCCSYGGWCRSPRAPWCLLLMVNWDNLCVWMFVSCQLSQWSMLGCGLAIHEACMMLSQTALITYFVTVIFSWKIMLLRLTVNVHDIIYLKYTWAVFHHVCAFWMNVCSGNLYSCLRVYMQASVHTASSYNERWPWPLSGCAIPQLLFICS